MIVMVRMIVPASSRNFRTRSQVTRTTLCQTGTRYGGSSSSSGSRGPRSTVRRSTVAAPRVATTERAYMVNRTTAPTLRMPNTRWSAVKTTAVTSALDRQPGTAGDHGQRQHRDQPVPRALDGAGRHDRRNGAREPGQHRDERLAMEPYSPHQPVDDERHPAR